MILYPFHPSVRTIDPGSTNCSMALLRLFLEASGMIQRRILPIRLPSTWAMTSTNVFPKAPRPRLPPYKCLIHLEDAGYSFSPRSYHRPTQFVYPRPSGSIATKSKNTVKSKRICSVFLARNVPHGTEPETKRLLCVLKYCPSCYRGLKSALFTFKQSVRACPIFIVIARRTTEAIRLTKL